MRLEIPSPSLVLLVGPAGCGKSTFARRHFRPSEVVSSDACRGMIADDERDQSASADAFGLLRAIVDRRLARRLLTVVDATNVRSRSRRPLLDLARHHDLPAAAIVFALPAALCLERNAGRAERVVPPDVVERQAAQLHESRRTIWREGFAAVHLLADPAAVERAEPVRVPLPPDRREVRGPFDLIGDVHGCADELFALLARLGYEAAGGTWRHPEGRRAVFLGDLVDRGPRVVDVLRTVMAMTVAGDALAVPGNHDDKLRRKLQGRAVHVRHGLQQTLDELAREGEAFCHAVLRFLCSLPSHLVLDDGRLVAAHAGLREWLHGRDAPRVRDLALFGPTTGEYDANGLPERIDWAADYRGRALVVYGHTPVAVPRWLNNTVNLDTGCVFGGALTALRYPEREVVSVPARAAYAESARGIAVGGGEAGG